MKVLLLGGTGTLSTATLHCALMKGYEVSVMNRGSNNGILPRNVNPIIGDFQNVNLLYNLFRDSSFDVVVDFLSRTPKDIERVFPIFQDKCSQYIFISSACVYRRDKEDFPIREDAPKPNTQWGYNIAKYHAELKLQELSKYGKCYYTIVRPYITYDNNRIPLGITPAYKYHKTIIERIKAGKPWFVWDDGKSICTLTHTKDFAVGLVGLFLNPMSRNEDFHITSDFRYEQIEVIKLLFSKLGMPLKVKKCSALKMASLLPEYRGLLLGDRALDAVFDNSKIKIAVPELKFEISLENGIDEIIDNWNNQRHFQYDYKFEGRIDRMLSKIDCDTKFFAYPSSDDKDRTVYSIYRKFPLVFSRHLIKYIK